MLYGTWVCCKILSVSLITLSISVWNGAENTNTLGGPVGLPRLNSSFVDRPLTTYVLRRRHTMLPCSTLVLPYESTFLRTSLLCCFLSSGDSASSSIRHHVLDLSRIIAMLPDAALHLEPEQLLHLVHGDIDALPERELAVLIVLGQRDEILETPLTVVQSNIVLGQVVDLAQSRPSEQKSGVQTNNEEVSRVVWLIKVIVILETIRERDLLCQTWGYGHVMCFAIIDGLHGLVPSFVVFVSVAKVLELGLVDVLDIPAAKIFRFELLPSFISGVWANLAYLESSGVGGCLIVAGAVAVGTQIMIG